jgi:hypothetical protein
MYFISSRVSKVSAERDPVAKSLNSLRAPKANGAQSLSSSKDWRSLKWCKNSEASGAPWTLGAVGSLGTSIVLGALETEEPCELWVSLPKIPSLFFTASAKTKQKKRKKKMLAPSKRDLLRQFCAELLGTFLLVRTFSKHWSLFF